MICLHLGSTDHLFCLHSSSTVCSFIKYTVLFPHRINLYMRKCKISIFSVFLDTSFIWHLSIHVHSQEPNSSSSVGKSSCFTNLVIPGKVSSTHHLLFCCLSKLKDKYYHTGAQEAGEKILLCVIRHFQPTLHPTSATPNDLIFAQIVPAQEYNFKLKKVLGGSIPHFMVLTFKHIYIWQVLFCFLTIICWMERFLCLFSFERCTGQFSQKQQSLLTSRNQKQVPSRGNLAVSVENSSKNSVLKQNCKDLAMFWP